MRSRSRDQGSLRRRAGVAGLSLLGAADAAYMLVRAWCFWCLSSAAINVGLLPLALAEARSR